MLLIGSRALATWIDIGRKPVDYDYICTFDQLQLWQREHKEQIQMSVPLSGDKWHVRFKDGMNYEFEIAWPDTSGAILLSWLNCDHIHSRVVVCPLEYLYALKMSHRYKKNSVHFNKTMADIHLMRNHLSTEEQAEAVESAWFKKREAETYTYAHPKLDVTKQDFFSGDSVPYVYDHDSLHLTVALLNEYSWPDDSRSVVATPRPAYTFYMKDGSEVMTSKEKFMSVKHEVRIYGVYEESCVLALERSQIPHGLGKEGGPTARWSFEKALEKVATSITSGWFREFAWENYKEVLDLYNQLGETDYIERFKASAHLLKPFEGAV